MLSHASHTVPKRCGLCEYLSPLPTSCVFSYFSLSFLSLLLPLPFSPSSQPLSPFSVPLFLLILSPPSQFHRSLPGPPDLTPAEVSSLVQRYRDPSSGLYNYMQFHNDIERLGREEEGGGSGPPQPLSMPVRMIPRLFLFNHDHLQYIYTATIWSSCIGYIIMSTLSCL